MQCSPMDNFTADRLIAAHDGDVALLYIYLPVSYTHLRAHET